MKDAPRPDLEAIRERARYTYHGVAQADVFALYAYTISLERRLADLQRRLTAGVDRIVIQDELPSWK